MLARIFFCGEDVGADFYFVGSFCAYDVGVIFTAEEEGDDFFQYC